MSNDYNISISSDEVTRKYFDNFSIEDMLKWFRRTIWTANPFPFVLPSSTRLAPFLSITFSSYPDEVVIKIKEILTTLLQEWRTLDNLDILDDIILLIANFRCANAIPVIKNIYESKLVHLEHEKTKEIRSRMLSVLAGFGVTASTEHLFLKGLSEPLLCNLSFRALYLYDHKYILSGLKIVLDSYDLEKQNSVPIQLKYIIKQLIEYIYNSGGEVYTSSIFSAIFKKYSVSDYKKIAKILVELGTEITTVDNVIIYCVPFDGENFEIEIDAKQFSNEPEKICEMLPENISSDIMEEFIQNQAGKYS